MEEKKKDIHWYPGHMTKAIRQMQEDIKLIDVVVEIVDARIPMSSKNPEIDTLAKGKSRILLLNKADLADEDQTEAWTTWYEGKGFLVAAINAKNGNGVRKIRDLVAEAAKEQRERDRKRGILNRPSECGKVHLYQQFCRQSGHKDRQYARRHARKAVDSSEQGSGAARYARDSLAEI